jgi:U3 small nucleolar RNA-associated protein 22
LVGSYLLHSIVKPNCNVDIAIQIPNSCFVPKDVLDYRYHDKRRLYLSAIANELSKEISFSDIEIQGWREGNDISKPILVFKLACDANNNNGQNDKVS